MQVIVKLETLAYNKVKLHVFSSQITKDPASYFLLRPPLLLLARVEGALLSSYI